MSTLECLGVVFPLIKLRVTSFPIGKKKWQAKRFLFEFGMMQASLNESPRIFFRHPASSLDC